MKANLLITPSECVLPTSMDSSLNTPLCKAGGGPRHCRRVRGRMPLGPYRTLGSELASLNTLPQNPPVPFSLRILRLKICDSEGFTTVYGAPSDYVDFLPARGRRLLVPKIISAILGTPRTRHQLRRCRRVPRISDYGLRRPADQSRLFNRHRKRRHKHKEPDLVVLQDRH